MQRRRRHALLGALKPAITVLPGEDTFTFCRWASEGAIELSYSSEARSRDGSQAVGVLYPVILLDIVEGQMELMFRLDKSHFVLGERNSIGQVLSCSGFCGAPRTTPRMGIIAEGLSWKVCP